MRCFEGYLSVRAERNRRRAQAALSSRRRRTFYSPILPSATQLLPSSGAFGRGGTCTEGLQKASRRGSSSQKGFARPRSYASEGCEPEVKAAITTQARSATLKFLKLHPFPDQIQRHRSSLNGCTGRGHYDLHLPPPLPPVKGQKCGFQAPRDSRKDARHRASASVGRHSDLHLPLHHMASQALDREV